MPRRVCIGIAAAMFLTLACSTGGAAPDATNAVIMNCNVSDPSPPAVADTISKFRSTITADSTIATGTVSGVIMNAHTGARLQKAAVVLRSSTDQNRWVVTDSDGAFVLTNVPAGPTVLDVRLIGYRSVTINIDAHVGLKVDVALAINPLKLSC